MKIIYFLLGLLFVCKEGRALLDGGPIYACPNTDVFFPYFVNYSTHLKDYLVWIYKENNQTASKPIGAVFNNQFMSTSHYNNRATLNKTGNFILKNVDVKDTGYYTLNYPGSVFYINGHDLKPQKIFLLVVPEQFMFKGNNITVELANKAEWNPETNSVHVTLTCGDFVFKNGAVPIDVKWTTPDGSVKNSTKYSDGKFYLQLDNPVKGGQYVCKVPQEVHSSLCSKTNEPILSSFNINQEENRAAQSAIEIKQLKNQVEELKKTDLDLAETLSRDCSDWYRSYNKASGKRKINLSCPTKSSVEIYCDQDTAGGKWNVFQRREDGSENFYRGWSDYRNGFGDLDKEFWLGLETVHRMTNDGRKYQLRIDLEKEDGSKYFATWSDFSIGSEAQGYTLNFNRLVSTSNPPAGENLAHHRGMKFTTKDRNNDVNSRSPSYNCAVVCMGAWWYNHCAHSNLNGHYGDKSFCKGVMWHYLTTSKGSLKRTEMKFRLQN